MQIQALTMNKHELTAIMPFPDFLEGPLMSRLAALNNDCPPAEIIRDYLPTGLEEADDEELAQAVAEACTSACGLEPAPRIPMRGGPALEVTGVQVEAEDIPAIRQMLLSPTGLHLLEPVGFEPLPAA